MKPHKNRIDVITMGCSKNLVDSERLMKQLEAKGYEMHHDSDDVCGEIAIVNTCGFIGDAKEESINMILQLAEAKQDGRIGKLIVMGCLSERYMKELREEITEVDEYYGKFNWTEIIDNLPDRSTSAPHLKIWERSLTTPKWSAFVKISEGCNRFCAYCAIPLITGRHKSRSIEEIVEEVKSLVSDGVKEFNIIAQDLSAYGTDIYGNSRLADLIEAISDVKGVEWIRLHYAYPVDFPWDVLRVMRERNNVCNYLDIALQHIADPVLKNMRRHITKTETLQLIKRIREEVPGIRLRTTLMTGFPGEGEKEFEELMEFVKEAKFDRMGAFTYSEEEDTWAARNLSDSIPQEVKQKRLDLIMDEQQNISDQLHERLLGQSVRVLVETVTPTELIGRTEWDSPEVDPEIHIAITDKDRQITPGEFVHATITNTYPFELFATLDK